MRQCVTANARRAWTATALAAIAWAGLSISQAGAAGGLPRDVQAFVKKREACDHFRGEESDDPKRRAFILANQKKLCTGSDNALRQLKRKHRGNPAAMKALEVFEERIE